MIECRIAGPLQGPFECRKEAVLDRAGFVKNPGRSLRDLISRVAAELAAESVHPLLLIPFVRAILLHCCAQSNVSKHWSPARRASSGAMLNTGTFLMAGGGVSDGDLGASSVLYDPASLTFAPTALAVGMTAAHLT